uniref:Uncharacterized protein n=1 Tax=viral metagenome TaxID=1070528 RepID=A0A6M3JJC8_9ZZZZ
MSRQAILDSIKKWDLIISGKGVDDGVDNCPLCKEYLDNGCYGCPVYKVTGEERCEESAYTDWADYMFYYCHQYQPYSIGDLDEDKKPRAIELAKKERDFLESLLEEEREETPSYFLLLYDYDMGEWYFHGVWDDIEKARKIAAKSDGYQIIQGKRIEKVMHEDENEINS